MNRTQELRKLADDITAADLVDAMGRMHRHRSHILDMVTPTPERVLFGPAVTISFFPTCERVLDPERYNFARLFYEAAGEEPDGKVLVLAGNGHPDASLAGGTKLSRLDNLGMAGVVADGRLRDLDQLAEFDFATYCRGETTRWGGDAVTPFQANVPVVISGVGIFPGDYIYGKKRLREIDRRVRYLTRRLDSAVVVKPQEQQGDVVRFGATVEVLDEAGNRKTFLLVGPDEADPAKGKLSFQSPMGRSLLKRRVGEVVVVKRPAGEIEIEIVSVTFGE